MELTQRHHELQRLAGDWRGEERHHPARPLGDPRDAYGLWRLRPALGELALVGDYSQRRGGVEVFAAHAVFSADAAAIHLHWLDSEGGRVETYSGDFVDGMLQLEAGDAAHATRIRLALQTDGRLEYELAFREPDGLWRSLVEGDYLRYAEG